MKIRFLPLVIAAALIVGAAQATEPAHSSKPRVRRSTAWSNASRSCRRNWVTTATCASSSAAASTWPAGRCRTSSWTTAGRTSK